MPLFSITGLSGTGKSTVNAELKARGYESYDGDEDHLAGWYDSATGLPVEVNIEECTPEFLLNHSRDISRQTVEGLAAKAHGKPVFLCGAHENEIAAGIIAPKSSWSPAFGAAFESALKPQSEMKTVEFGCALSEGSFEVTIAEDGQYTVSVVKGDVLLSFLMGLLARLQLLGTVPAIDYKAYGSGRKQ